MVQFHVGFSHEIGLIIVKLSTPVPWLVFLVCEGLAPLNEALILSSWVQYKPP